MNRVAKIGRATEWVKMPNPVAAILLKTEDLANFQGWGENQTGCFVHSAAGLPVQLLHVRWYGIGTAQCSH
jgi:hypothetical protein